MRRKSTSQYTIAACPAQRRPRNRVQMPVYRLGPSPVFPPPEQAEESGVLLGLSPWLFGQACKAAASWRR